MDLQLIGKTALVSGSTSSIGHAIATRLAKEGASVIINGRSKKRVQVAMDVILKHSPKAHLLSAPFDLSTDDGVQDLLQTYPMVDILINNLGIYQVKNFLAITDQEWLNIFNMNVLSGIKLSRHYIRHMLKNGWGRIVFISSESALNIPSEMIHYGMTKTAQLAVARGLATMTTDTGITVNSLLVGPTFTEGLESFIKDVAKEKQMSMEEAEQDFFTTVRPTSLIKRFLKPEEIADFAAFLASPLASGITGAALRIEGGVLNSII